MLQKGNNNYTLNHYFYFPKIRIIVQPSQKKKNYIFVLSFLSSGQKSLYFENKRIPNLANNIIAISITILKPSILTGFFRVRLFKIFIVFSISDEYLMSCKASINSRLFAAVSVFINCYHQMLL